VATPAPSTLSDSSIAEVRRVVLEGLGAVRAKVWLFGSRAAGRARENSDIDVAVLPLAPLDAGILPAIRDALEESHVPWRVDIVDLRSASPELRSSVENDGILWTA